MSETDPELDAEYREFVRSVHKDTIAAFWSFRNRIILAEKGLRSSDQSVALTENITLTAEHSGTGFSGADWLMLEGQRYSSSDQAYDAGKRWRHQLSVAFANAGIAADFDAPPLPDHHENDRPKSPEAPGLRVFPQPPGLTLHIGVRANAYVSRPLETFLSQNLNPVRKSIPQGLSRRLELAYTTFHMALATKPAELKFILFVTAIEALIDDKEKPQPILDALAMLQAYVDDESTDFAPEAKKRLSEILKEDKTESITQLGAQLASQLSSTYGNKEPSGFFKHVYKCRSKIVHGATEYTGKNKRLTAYCTTGCGHSPRITEIRA